MTIISRITAKGQTTLPAAVRANLGVGPGDLVEYTEQPDGQYMVRKAQHGLQCLRGILKPDFPASGADIDQWCRDVRDGGMGHE